MSCAFFVMCNFLSQAIVFFVFVKTDKVSSKFHEWKLKLVWHFWKIKFKWPHAHDKIKHENCQIEGNPRKKPSLIETNYSKCIIFLKINNHILQNISSEDLLTYEKVWIRFKNYYISLFKEDYTVTAYSKLSLKDFKLLWVFLWLPS